MLLFFFVVEECLVSRRHQIRFRHDTIRIVIQNRTMTFAILLVQCGLDPTKIIRAQLRQDRLDFSNAAHAQNLSAKTTVVNDSISTPRPPQLKAVATRDRNGKVSSSAGDSSM
jgi:hypothetical protein